MDYKYDILKHIADKADSNGITINDLLTEFTNSQCAVARVRGYGLARFESDYGNVWDSRGYWWTNERVDAFSSWVHEEHIFDPANPRWQE